MFRPQFPPRGKGSVVRQLTAMPSAALVQLFHGQVWQKAVKRWMPAGTIGEPISSTALALLNGNVMPVRLLPAWTPVGEAS